MSSPVPESSPGFASSPLARRPWGSDTTVAGPSGLRRHNNQEDDETIQDREEQHSEDRDENEDKDESEDKSDEDDMDRRLSQDPLLIHNEKGKYVRVPDTRYNRRRQQAGVDKFGTMVTHVEDDELFARIEDSDDQQGPRARKGVVQDDDSQKAIDAITIGTAYVDVRHLQLEWKDNTGMTQRPVNAHHVERLKQSFAVEIRRVEPGKRLYVSMTPADLTTAIDATAEKLEIDAQTLAENIEKGEKNAGGRYKEASQVPRLIMPIVPESSPVSRVTCRVEAGQHRVLALKEFARENMPDHTKVKANDLVSKDTEAATDAIKWYGWTVIILDADKIVQRANRRALAVIRRNPEDVYAQDSEGVLFSTAIAHFNAIDDAGRALALHDFNEFCRLFLKTTAKDAKRLKRIFKNPGMRVVMEAFTATAWGRELYTQLRLEQMVATRVVKLIESVITEAMLRISDVLEPSNMPRIRHSLPNLAADADMKVTLLELEALAECFGEKGLHQNRWLQLFYPVESSKEGSEVKSLPALNYSKHVRLPENRMPASTDAQRDNRHYRRPYFLSFLNHQQYHCVFSYNRERGSRVSWVSQPINPVAGAIFLPTRKWFTRFCETDLPRFTAALRLHWFCAAPEHYKNITCFGPNATGKGIDEKFDVGVTFQSHYVQWTVKFTEKQIALQNNAADEEPEPEEPDTPRQNPLRAAVQQKQIQRHAINTAVTDAARQATKEFADYLVDLFDVCSVSEHSVKDFQDACFIRYDYIYDHGRHSSSVSKFYRQMLDHRWLRKTFTHAFFRHLSEGYLAGIAQVLARSDFGATETKSGINFFDLKTPVQLDTYDSTVSAIAQFPHFKSLKKSDKMALQHTLAPWMDIFIHSINIAHLGHQLYFFNLTVASMKLPEPIDWNNPEIWKKNHGVANNATRLKMLQTLSEAMERLRSHWSVTTLNDVGVTSFLSKPPSEQLQLLPHSGAIRLDPRALRSNGTMHVPPPPGKDLHFQYEDMINDWFVDTGRAVVPYDAMDAQNYFHEIAMDKERNKRKNEAAKVQRQVKAAGAKAGGAKATGAKATGVKPTGARAGGAQRKPLKSKERVDPVDDEDESDLAPAPPPPRKRRRTHVQAETSQAPNPAEIAPDASVAEEAEEEDEAGATEEEDEAEATQEEDETDEADEEEDTPRRADRRYFIPKDLDWGDEVTLPEATIQTLATILKVSEKNQREWRNAQGLKGKALGSHTTKAKTRRLQLVRDRIVFAGTKWFPVNHNALPSALQYVPKAAWDKQQKQSTAAAPGASSKGRKGGGKKVPRASK